MAERDPIDQLYDAEGDQAFDNEAEDRRGNPWVIAAWVGFVGLWMQIAAPVESSVWFRLVNLGFMVVLGVWAWTLHRYWEPVLRSLWRGGWARIRPRQKRPRRSRRDPDL
ncbi:MAG TPA: hypothetical protein PLQ03_10875 [Brevundimonas sp.]|uniref:hypothetical protein n=1 Tax=Brevundimonas sp. TaxID=1871086 RepID=UPI00260F9F4E|nr:hypothetical protein [Brevundimonas sp.]HRO33903.1 hypothetical protein [Brevundimonas sp.]